MEIDGTLRTERLVLEPLSHTHASELFEALSDPRIFTYIPHEPPASVAELELRLRRKQVRRSPCRSEVWLNWTVRLRDGGAAIGRVEATVREDRTALFAYELAPARWGQGFATEACSAVLDALFEEYPLDRVIAEIDTRNAASIRLVERLGFRRTGTKIAADHFKGASSDEHTYVRERGDR